MTGNMGHGGTAAAIIRANQAARDEAARTHHTPEPYPGSTSGAPRDPAALDEPDVSAAPRVPGGEGGSGEIAVDTASIDQFGKNMEALTEPVRAAMSRMQDLAVGPGGFPQAVALKTQVERQGAQFAAVLNVLLEGLVDLGRDMRELAKDYDTTEEANAMKADVLQKAIGESGSSFTGLLSASPPETTQ